jgi:hypothetical protein
VRVNIAYWAIMGILALTALTFGFLAIWTGDVRWAQSILLPAIPFGICLIFGPLFWDEEW